MVDPTACTGHGLCAELLPELIALDEWGYPVIDGQPVPAGLDRPGQACRHGLPGAGPAASEETQRQRIMPT